MTHPQPTSPGISRTVVEVVPAGDVVLVNILGLVDERFQDFGDVGAASTIVIDVSGITRMTSFGVLQWLRAMAALPKTVDHLYLARCPPLFVDQLNMVLKFGGTSRVLSVLAPYTCLTCGLETDEPIDVLTEREPILRGDIPRKLCTRCGNELIFDEIPESYFACVRTYGATSVEPAVAKLLASRGSSAGTVRPLFAVPTGAAVASTRKPHSEALKLEPAPSRYELTPGGIVVLAAIVLVLVVGAYVLGRAI